MARKRKLKGNKKGSLPDIIFVGIVLLFAAMVILFGFKITSSINDQVQVNSLMDDRARDASSSLTGHYPGVINNSFLLFAVGAGLATLVLAALVRINPIFIPFFFIGLTIVIFMSAMFSNIYQEAAADPQLVVEANQLTFISGILNTLPVIVAVFGILLMVVMYKIWDSGT